MKRHELIEALMKFSEQTGVDWYEWEEWIDTDIELCVVFKLEEDDDE